MRRRHGMVIGLLAATLLAAACTGRGVPGPGTWGSASGHADRVTSLPGLGGVATPQFAGYSSVGPEPCADLRCRGRDEAGLFYWFVGKSRAYRSSPTILWTNGGPGATSFWGFFTENGPYEVEAGGRLRERFMAWNESANYLIFDQPLGVGLSFAPESRLPDNVGEGVNQWYTALVHFLERHPEIAANPIILAGESYGGTYDALLAKAILDGNARAGREVVRLGGVLIAAGWVDPVVQQSMDTTYALAHGLITADDKARLDQTFEQCRAAVVAQAPSSAQADELCGKIKSGIAEISGRYLLNLAETGDPPTDPLVAYLNRRDVRRAIHAKPSGRFDMFAEAIGKRYVVGEQDSYRSVVQEVLDRGVPVMVVSGLNDATDVNFLGTGAWLDLLSGERAARFRAAPTTQWQADGRGEVLGYLQQGGGLSWVKVLNAGHLAVGDQPLLILLVRNTLLAR